ncbi:sulfite exporter TauE/SafE family protein [Streptomyces spinosirectus]|uniref:urease accessory protein UreH domain-containing protein n=1 Tax=Streptomyces TaxID=1883 RepID=UPI001C9DCF7B|nr:MULTISPECIES: sulfite exporter TauE/SafE family protein [Streptomyces]MBY8343933.1 sulfite exporter TauE/SafE family protein [Streptomyces plumbidurans]UIR17122.1 sulfite exporter TauE/SafE family protein [Streptomyces spinosirectus]
MNPRRLLASTGAVLTAACALALTPSTSASAHPLGNFTVNRYDGLVATPDRLRVDHVEDLAEIPATQAKPDIERLGTTEWARERCAKAADGSKVTVDGRAAHLTVAGITARLRPGQAGLNTLRVECRLTAPLPEGDTVTVGFHSAGANSGPGWREITARGDRMTLTATDVPKSSVSRELTSYPKELLTSPADTSSASLRVRPGGPALTEDRQDAPAASVLPRGADRWTRALDSLVARHDLTVGFAALALLIAVVLGAMHALAPGHGKTLMAATAAARGGRARLKDVLPLAASVTVTHTLGVVALGLLVTAGSGAAPSVITWLGIASGVMVFCAGATLVRRAWRNRGPGHTHTHTHGHPHPHGPDAHPHTHGTDEPEVRELALVAAHTQTATATTEAHPHPHPHQPAHTHDHGQDPTYPHTHPHDHDHPHDHAHTHPHSVEHTHGGFTHTHSTAPTLRGTILLGFAGGLVPSPSAVVVLVGAAALGQAWFGLLLVVAYGVGLALTLTAAGFAVVKLGTGMNRLLDRRPRWTGHPVATLVRRNAPLASAFLVVALGIGLVLKGAASALG